ncbi:MAG: hypothetical protein JRG96_08145 [Deltaproteobacteria bacterium]|nr:hypothetical protein [Deltaproteobacteria bacterium]MBW2419812.1 hypothetical protein [Deltaproteobacteria bacterium]
MTSEQPDQRVLIFRGLALVGLVLMALSFFAPLWWVSLKAPNYPEHTFPDGVRIHMHWTGVENGCKPRESQEVFEDEAMDCVHEMNTINHYIGMAPIEKGAQVEFTIAPYVFVLFGLGVIAALFYSGPVWWVLMIPAIILPLAFLIDFTFWLWWFGHNLHEWAAFTVKPFMPTVLGEGKVAQFNTYAYPHYGMLLSAASAVTLALALLIRRKQLQEKG